ncbi:hypothetical protein CA234_09715 [Sphingomonas sp. ABOLE]|uniref:hypothetical protein n=1 Tax=Sphingomonas sp. ABOLE TaxID=1985878 RepID=UPI000F7F91E7|nr:hypothetical protein [Sphingomonas sp. ABOLE]RSV41535.1 hypothetical protein CA234_09715 [Sphingomonas sp. ABOLE]
MSTTKTAYALKTFRDAGTEKEYEGDKAHDFTDGEYRNFKAAGLISDQKPAPAKAADKPAA